MRPPTRPRRRGLRPQLEKETRLVALAAARSVVEEASQWFGAPLPTRYAYRLAVQAHVAYAQSDTFRRGFRRRPDGGRERLYAFLRHWLAAILHTDAPALYARLPLGYRTGEPLPARALAPWPRPLPLPASSPFLSPETRLLAAF